MSGFFKRAIFLIPLLFFVFSSFALAVTEDECRQRQQKDVDDGIACWQQLLNEVGQKKATLQSEIVKFNTSISLTLAKIDQTAKQIKTLETEIVGLTTQITKLDVSLNQLSQILIKRIAATYKKGKVEPLSLLFSSVDFSEFVSRYKYLRVMQIHDRQLMVQTENVRTNFEDQKTLKEQKQDELQVAKKKSESQKALLAQQKAAKENLLQVTQNDEAKYQQLLAQAKAQSAAFRKFVADQGGASILNNQTKCDAWGCYYNQRDSQWGNMFIGLSNSRMADEGCLVSSVAMVAKHYGKNITPADIASSPAAFSASTALMRKDWSDKGITVSRKGFSPSTDKIDSEINAGRPVIVGLYGSYSYPEHFIVIKSKNAGAYIMNDPFLENGADKPLTDKYNFSNIVRVDVVTIN